MPSWRRIYTLSGLQWPCHFVIYDASIFDMIRAKQLRISTKPNVGEIDIFLHATLEKVQI